MVPRFKKKLMTDINTEGHGAELKSAFVYGCDNEHSKYQQATNNNKC